MIEEFAGVIYSIAYYWAMLFYLGYAIVASKITSVLITIMACTVSSLCKRFLQHCNARKAVFNSV
ncbi:MAG: hypothetical protein QM541_06520 [Flavobacterium sp.]|nr:hypothetical protein [Flavobacterium sp.]